MDNNFSWVPLYEELAKKLLDCKKDRKPLVDWIYNELSSITSSSGGSLVKYLKKKDGSEIEDIDPLSVFGIFNRNLKWENRTAFLEKFKKHFSLQSEVPTDFNGIPTLDPRRAFFFSWEDNNDIVIRNLWTLYEKVVNKEEDIEDAFNNVLSDGMPPYILTMALFWISPHHFIALDSRNRTYLTTIGLPKDYKDFNYSVYKELLDKVVPTAQAHNLPINSYIDFSYTAWITTSQSSNTVKETTPKLTPSSPHYWIYAPGENASKWAECQNNGMMYLGWDQMGDYSQYASMDEIQKKLQEVYNKPESSFMNDRLALWEFCHVIKPGDVVFVKQGKSKILGRGVVTGDYFYDKTRTTFNNCRKVNWTHTGEWAAPQESALKTLTDVTKYTDYVKDLEALFSKKEPDEKQLNTPYTEKDFLNDVYISKESYESLKALLLDKKNIILQGAPGVGKTFSAKKLAYSIMGEIDKSRVEFIQFHQSYSYEDFIMGYKPNEEGGFYLKKGVFYNFCKAAKADPNRPYFFIIDEINRGNMSKIFGELLMLIENQYRGESVKLAYNDELFSVPENLYIIGMMNTADRSLAMIDYALRRRFSFIDMKPGFDSEGFKKYQASLNSNLFNKAIETINLVNEVIAKDDSLGEGFCIGHSYFCNQIAFSEQWLKNVIDYDIIPMLREYWFDNNQQFEQQVTKLKGIF